MSWYEILIIVIATCFVVFIVGQYIYKRIKGLPTGECAYCASNGKSKLLKSYYKKYKKQR